MEKEFAERAIEVVDDWEDYVELPGQFDIHEYSIIEDFAESITDNRKRSVLYRSMKGKGAFRRFKDKGRGVKYAKEKRNDNERIKKVSY